MSKRLWTGLLVGVMAPWRGRVAPSTTATSTPGRGQDARATGPGGGSATARSDRSSCNPAGIVDRRMGHPVPGSTNDRQVPEPASRG